jgi:23S rRNA (uracil1939-C5)-methyltransferase
MKTKQLNPGDLFEVMTERMSFGPAAVGRLELPGEPKPMVVFVEGAAPQEQVRAKLVKKHKTYWEAVLIEVLKASPDRITPPCPIFQKCGGCQWQFLDYPAQLRAKEEILLHQIARTTRIPQDELRPLLKVHGAAKPFGYRTRLQAHGDGKGLGFFAKNSHNIAYTDKCLVAHPDIQSAWSQFLATRPLRDLAKATGQFKVEWTRTDSGQISEAINRKHGFHGFTQVNPEQNIVMKNIVSEMARACSKKEVLFDLYGGSGNLSNALTADFKKTVCVDSHNDGVAPSEVKAPLSEGMTVVKSTVEDFLIDQKWKDWTGDRVDCVIADPPRNGLQGASSRILDLRAPCIILVACDPATLARDLTTFTTKYHLTAIHLIDMFPQTFHIEAIVELSARP